jgi:hypothetical protein
MSYYERYQKEECVAVWQELLDQGEAARQAPLLEDARQTAELCMRRARASIERLVERLKNDGYRFTNDPLAASGDVDAQLDRLTSVGPLPIALEAFYRQLGAVDLRGQHPELAKLGPLRETSTLATIGDPEQYVYSDPLVVPPLEALVDEALDRRAELEQLEPDEGLMITFSGDIIAKAEPTGGVYGILLPDGSLDTDLDVHTATTFADYLRDALRWGGFPGLHHYEGPPLALIERLRADFEPF